MGKSIIFREQAKACDWDRGNGGDSGERCGQRDRRDKVTETPKGCLDFISVLTGCRSRVLNREVMCSDWHYRFTLPLCGGWAGRDSSRGEETSWEVGPETQMLVVSWSRAVIKEVREVLGLLVDWHGLQVARDDV